MCVERFVRDTWRRLLYGCWWEEAYGGRVCRPSAVNLCRRETEDDMSTEEAST